MGQCRSPSVSPSRQAVSSASPVQEELSLFQLYLQEGNPFEMHAEHREEETEDVLASNGVSGKADAKMFPIEGFLIILELLVFVWNVCCKSLQK